MVKKNYSLDLTSITNNYSSWTLPRCGVEPTGQSMQSIPLKQMYTVLAISGSLGLCRTLLSLRMPFIAARTHTWIQKGNVGFGDLHRKWSIHGRTRQSHRNRKSSLRERGPRKFLQLLGGNSQRWARANKNEIRLLKPLWMKGEKTYDLANQSLHCVNNYLPTVILPFTSGSHTDCSFHAVCREQC